MNMHDLACRLEATPLLHFEIVFDDDDLFVSLNGPWKPSDFESYSVDDNGSFLLHGVESEVATMPMPEELREWMGTADNTWFVKIEDGQVVDQKVLPRSEYIIY